MSGAEPLRNMCACLDLLARITTTQIATVISRNRAGSVIANARVYNGMPFFLLSCCGDVGDEGGGVDGGREGGLGEGDGGVGAEGWGEGGGVGRGDGEGEGEGGGSGGGEGGGGGGLGLGLGLGDGGSGEGGGVGGIGEAATDKHTCIATG